MSASNNVRKYVDKDISNFDARERARAARSSGTSRSWRLVMHAC